MTLDDRELDPREGIGAAAIAFMAFLVAVGLVIGFAVGFNAGKGSSVSEGPAPISRSVPSSTSSTSSTASATSSASVTSTTTITARRKPRTIPPRAGEQQAREGAGLPSEPPATGSLVVGAPGEPDGWEIVIQHETTATSSAASAASSSAAVVHNPVDPVDNHARLGVMVGLVPGVFMASWQLGAVEVPAWVFGRELELGLDLVGNHRALGAGVTAGGKAYAIAGGWASWELDAGLLVGVGLRF